MLIFTLQNKPSFSSHTCTAMSHESLEAFDNNDYETWCEKKKIMAYLSLLAFAQNFRALW